MRPQDAMLEEIREQRELLAQIFEQRETLCRKFVERFQQHPFRKVLFVGNGSPYYAGYALSFAAEKLLGAEAEAIPAAIFHNYKTFDPSGSFRPEDILLVCPAESGHSRGQVDAARRAKAAGVCVMSTTLIPTGVLARTSDIVLPKLGVHEVAMAATKGQTMAIFMILLNFLEAAYASGRLEKAEYDRYLDACRQLPENVAAIIEDTTAWFEDHKESVMGAEKYFLLGYGANYGTVQEAGLKFFECHGKPTFSLELEESLHGPFRALGKKDMAFLLAAEAGFQRERMLLLTEAAEQYCDNMILIQRKGSPARKNDLQIHSTDVEFVNTIEYLVPLQMLSFLISQEMGIDLSIPLVSGLDGIMLPGYED